jgi:hypothetical protein
MFTTPSVVLNVSLPEKDKRSKAAATRYRKGLLSNLSVNSTVS